VSQYLGHSNIQITLKIYARFMPEHLADATATLEFDRFGDLRRTSQKQPKLLKDMVGDERLELPTSSV
jgi:hypothetical protein